MLYQLESPLSTLIIALDFLVVGLLLRLLVRPQGLSAKWPVVLAVIVLTVPLSALKLLLSSPGSAASSPGLVSIRNPERRIDKLYYLRERSEGVWQVEWIDYLLASDDQVVLENEGPSRWQLAWHHAGKWQYVPIRFAGSAQAEIRFPQSFTAVDTSGRIENAVASHTLSELGTWLSNLLTLGSIALAAAVLLRLPAARSRPVMTA